MDEQELVGEPLEHVPKRDPTGERCMGRKKMKRDGEVVRDDRGRALFGGYCRAWPGKKTDHVGEGRCAHHGGAGGRPMEHGIYADVVRDEDREVLDRLEEIRTAQKLEETLNLQVMKLRRAVELTEGPDDARDFWAMFEELVETAKQDGELDSGIVRELVNMLQAPASAQHDLMDLIRKTAKDLHQITEGQDINVQQSVDDETLDAVRESIEQAYGADE